MQELEGSILICRTCGTDSATSPAISVANFREAPERVSIPIWGGCLAPPIVNRFCRYYGLRELWKGPPDGNGLTARKPDTPSDSPSIPYGIQGEGGGKGKGRGKELAGANATGVNAVVENSPVAENSAVEEVAGGNGSQTSTQGVLMGTLRECGFRCDATDGSIVKALLGKRVDSRDIGTACRGLRWLADNGQLRQSHGLDPGDALSMKILYAKSEKRPIWRVAEAAQHRVDSQTRKHKGDPAKVDVRAILADL